MSRRVLRTDSRSGMLALAAALALIVSLTMSFFSSPASAAVLGSQDNVGICHANNGVKQYVSESPNVDSIVVKTSGHDTHVDDIIPAFDYNVGAGVVHYPGKNLQFLSTLNNGCNTPSTVTPLSPTVVQSTCANGTGTVPSFTIRPVTGVVYSVNGTPVTGTVNGTPGTTVTITVAPLSSAYVLSSSASFTVTFTSSGCPIPVTPVAPSVAQSQCSNGVATSPSYTLNGPTGVLYSVSGNPVSGTVSATAGSTVTVTAAAASGYVLAAGSVTSFPLTFNAAPSCGGGTTGGGTTGGTSGGTTGSTPTVVNNLSMLKTGTANAVPGDELVWNLAVTNTSGAAATGFVVTDALPAGLAYSLAEGPGFVCNAVLQVISCTYNASLAVGQTANISVRALLDSTYQSVLVRNIATVDPNRSDSNAADNTSTADTSIAVPTAGGGTIGGGTTGGAVAPPTKPVVKPGKPAAGGGGGGALPFTGSHTSQLVQTGLAMFLLGWYFVTVGRRRPEHAR